MSENMLLAKSNSAIELNNQKLFTNNQPFSFHEILRSNYDENKQWQINVSNASHSNLISHKSPKLIKPHICTHCQKRFSR